MSIGVALPEWIFASGKTAPLVLLALVFIGLAVPILIIAYYLNNAERYVGTNKVMEETLVLYHRFGVKEMLRVPKMYEAIVPAKEFVRIPITPATVRPAPPPTANLPITPPLCDNPADEGHACATPSPGNAVDRSPPVTNHHAPGGLQTGYPVAWRLENCHDTATS